MIAGLLPQRTWLISTIGEKNNLIEMPFGATGRNNQLVPYDRDPTMETMQGFSSSYLGADAGPSFNLGQIFRRYWLLLLVLLILGGGAGFTSVVLSSPMFKARLLVEVQGTNMGLLKDGVFGGSFEA